MNRPTRSLLLAAALVLAGSGIGVVALLSASDESEPYPGFPEQFTNSEPPSFDSAVFQLTRDRLRVCVEAVELSQFDASKAVADVYRALEVAAREPRWSERNFGRGGGPVVDVDCPGEPYLLRPGVRFSGGKGTGNEPFVTQTSPYKLHVVVLKHERLDAIFNGEVLHRRAAEEILMQGHQGAEVSTGVYLSEEEFKDSNFLAELVMDGLSIKFRWTPSPDTCQQRGLKEGPC
jgi:hypothetical protein